MNRRSFLLGGTAVAVGSARQGIAVAKPATNCFGCDRAEMSVISRVFGDRVEIRVDVPIIKVPPHDPCWIEITVANHSHFAIRLTAAIHAMLVSAKVGGRECEPTSYGRIYGPFGALLGGGHRLLIGAKTLLTRTIAVNAYLDCSLPGNYDVCLWENLEWVESRQCEIWQHNVKATFDPNEVSKATRASRSKFAKTPFYYSERAL